MNMCPNHDCPKYHQPTSLKGGCDCGAALVRDDRGPTDEQLVRAAVDLLHMVPQVAELMVRDQRWLLEHAHDLYQRAIKGDEEAAARVKQIKRQIFTTNLEILMANSAMNN